MSVLRSKRSVLHIKLKQFTNGLAGWYGSVGILDLEIEMAINVFEEMLTGGHHNSLGRTEDVVDIINKDRSKLEDLFDCYASDDEVVRLRVSSAFKRLFRANRRWFIDYIDRFHTLVPLLQQPSAQWCLSTLQLELDDLFTEEQRLTAIEINKNQLAECNDWIVKIESIKYLEFMSKRDQVLKNWLVQQLGVTIKDKRKTVKKKASEALGRLGV